MARPSKVTEDQLLEYLRQCVEETGRMPVLKEMADHFGLRTTSSFCVLLARLEQKGFLKKESFKARSIQLTEKARGPGGLPVVGFVAAGPFTEAVEVVAGHLDVGDDFDAQRHFCLVVRGDSMIEAQIADGDIAVIRRQETCENGQIAVVVVDHEATLKRVYRERRQLRLEPANSRLKPFVVKDAVVKGVLVRILRDYRV